MTTLNLQVAASADDVYLSSDAGSGTTFSATFLAFRAGHSNTSSDVIRSFARFTSVSGLSGSTIDTAVLSLWGRGSDLGTPLTKITAEDAAAPTQISNQADGNGRTVTTAAVDWDSPGLSTSAFIASPSIVSVIQELADSHDPTVIQIRCDDDGSGQAAHNYIDASSYDENSAEAPKLDIDYTAGSGGGSSSNRGLLLRGVSGP